MGFIIKEFFLLKLATFLKVNLRGVANKGVGIGLPNEFSKNGEKFLIEVILPKYLNKDGDGMVMFDIGANAGFYTQNLSSSFSKAKIYSFEPNPHTCLILNRKFRGNENIFVNNFALGAERTRSKLFFYDSDKTTGHASINKKVFEFHKRTDLDSSEINIDTVDEYCCTQNIDRIDFMKIDTEGFEYNVLSGAKEMIKTGKISFIQFEFNEMNIVNRIFLKDFYELLPGYEFFRIKRNSIFPLNEYSSKEEIFIIQNLLAVKKELLRN